MINEYTDADAPIRASAVPHSLWYDPYPRPSTTATSASVNPFLRSQLMHRPVDLAICGLNLPLQHGLDVRRLLGGH
jgi:hypothetical protein